MQKSKDVKVVLLGDSGVGKSSILLRFVANEFKPTYESTLGAAFMAKTISFNDQPVKFQIWDTAGQERYHSLAPLYYKGENVLFNENFQFELDSNVAIVVYDITNRASFDVLKNWIKELKSHGPRDITIALVGNKIDLIEREVINYNEGSTYAKELGAVFNLTSAKENKGIEDLFFKIAEALEKKEKDVEAQYVSRVGKGSKLNKGKNDKKGSCC